jgi:hypothetical protein
MSTLYENPDDNLDENSDNSQNVNTI